MKLRYRIVMGIALLVSLGQGAYAGETAQPHPRALWATAPQARESSRQLATIATAREEKLLNSLRDHAATLKLQQRMTGLARPEILAPLFVRNLHALSANGAKPAKVREFLFDRQRVRLASTGGAIGGRVTVAGESIADEVFVLAFDSHGYYAGGSEASYADGSYYIGGLPAGSYYVMTMSDEYVDELYDNVDAPLSDKQGWRHAKTVQVQDGQSVDNVHFDLQKGAVLTGRLLSEDGLTPVDAFFAQLELVDPQTGASRLTVEVYPVDGFFEAHVPLLGSFKILAEVEEYGRTWYPNQTDFASAAVVNIHTYSDQISGIDITLHQTEQTIASGSISGLIRGEGQFVLAGLAFAFNAADTSFAGLALGLLGNYEFPGLAEGDYYIFADDYLANLIGGAENLVGEFYQDAYSLQTAQKVTVHAGEVTANVNFILNAGATVSGRVEDESGQPVDSILVIALDPSLFSGGTDEPLLSRLRVAASPTDENGNYTMTGLPAGSYLLRTFSQYSISIMFEAPFLNLVKGKHSGKVVDSYYPNADNLLNYKQASPIEVSAPVVISGINFHLQKAKYFSGRVTDADGVTATPGVVVLALTDTSGVPYPALGTSDADGDYHLGPLPNGRYKLLALTGLMGGQAHLSEYYSGERQFNAAPVLALDGASLADINFTLDRGAAIQGFIDLAGAGPRFPAGADTLWEFPVLIYNSVDGQLASYDFVQFTGGYRVDRLLPGSYKVLALPWSGLFSATYYGGGAAFNHALTQTIQLNYGQIAEADIKLDQAQGSIAGTINAADRSAPLPGALAIAYDATGHPLGVGVADIEFLSRESTLAQGRYRIGGLRAGVYYVRSFALSANIGMVSQLVGMAEGLMGDGLDDPFALLSGDSLGQLDLNLLIYQDQWHRGLAIAESFDLQEMIMKLSTLGLAGEYDAALSPIYLPLPYAQKIPDGAQSVTVAEGGAVTNIDFHLLPTTFTDWVTTVEEKNALPVGFSVAQNYPNPFNPETSLSFTLPQPASVQVTVYDALGRRLAVLADRRFTAGGHSLRWNGRDQSGRSVASGVYMAVVKTETERRVVKMLLMK
ncbi:MAG TPA: FlgD immunoglobulin-like domain containing protein [bacterium]|nr:FlgD immunoglobulin-like domain containing protein [bacterium]